MFKRKMEKLHEAVFSYSKSKERGNKKMIGKKMLFSLLKDSDNHNPVTIMVEKGEGNGANVQFQIHGDVKGIFVLSVELMSRVAELLKDKDDEIFAMWLSVMLKRLSNVIDSEKRNGDEKD